MMRKKLSLLTKLVGGREWRPHAEQRARIREEIYVNLPSSCFFPKKFSFKLKKIIFLDIYGRSLILAQSAQSAQFYFLIADLN